MLLMLISGAATIDQLQLLFEILQPIMKITTQSSDGACKIMT